MPSRPPNARADQRSTAALVYRKLYSTALWRAVRRAQLQAHPLCERCKAAGFIVAATVCNHVDPKTKLDPATFYDGPFSSVCQACHDQAIARDEHRGVRTTRPGYHGAVDADGWPIDPRHPANASR